MLQQFCNLFVIIIPINQNSVIFLDKAEPLIEPLSITVHLYPFCFVYFDIIIKTNKFRRVYKQGKEIELKNKEYELFLFLVMNADIVFDKETLYEKLWGLDSLGDTVTVATHINRLREKLEDDPSKPKHIQTVWGAGYRFKD